MDRMICIAFVIQLISNSINKIVIQAYVCMFIVYNQFITAACWKPLSIVVFCYFVFFFSFFRVVVRFISNGKHMEKRKSEEKYFEKYSFDVLYCINYMNYSSFELLYVYFLSILVVFCHN